MEKFPLKQSETPDQNLHPSITKNLKFFAILLLSVLSFSGKIQPSLSSAQIYPDYPETVHQPAPDGTSVIPIGKQAQIINGNLLQLIDSPESN